MNWIGRIWHRERLERQLDAELRFHVDEETARLVGAGVAPETARRTALAAFGGIEPIKEAARDARGTRWLEDAMRDVRYAARTMRRHPLFAAAAVLALAVGIGANTAIYGVLHALLIRPLAVPSPGELAYVIRTGPAAEGQRTLARTRFSYAGWRRTADAMKPANASTAAMSAVATMQMTPESADTAGAELIEAQLVTGDWFSTVGTTAEIGRLLTPIDDAAIGGQPGAVISDRFWTRRFARDPSILRTRVRLNGYPVAIVGVAAPGFDGFLVDDHVDVWAPTGLQQEVRYAINADMVDADASKPWRAQEGIFWLTLLVRVHQPSTRAAAAAAMAVAFRRDVDARAAAIRDPRQRAFVLQSRAVLADGSRGLSTLREAYGSPIVVLMATAALVLLVACANLANLLLARGIARSREFAVRLSLGAGRGRIARQLLTESVALALLGGAVGLVFARAGAAALLRLASGGPEPLPLDVPMNAPLVAFASTAALVTGILFGIVPALRLSRTDVNEAIKSGGRIVAARGAPAPGRLLVIAQVALSFTLLVGALLFVRTLRNLLTVDAGFDAAHLVSARFDPRMAGYTMKTMASLRERLLDAARGVAGADTVAVAMCGTLANCHAVSDIDVPGRPRGVGADADVQEDYVSPGYFRALGMTFASGRGFAPADTMDAPRVAIVNEAMARHFFGDENPIGRVFVEGEKYQIVGVVRDSRVNGLRESPPRMAFYPYSQHPQVPMRNLYVRVAGDVAAASQQLRAAVRRTDRGIAVREIVTLADLEDRSVARERLVSTLTGTFGLLAVAVACLGLYGLVSYSVTRRTNEIGVRLALGASPANVRWLVVRETMVLVAAGIAAGVAATVPAMRFVAALLYGLSPRDPATFASAVGLLAAVAVLAAAAPAWRASRVDPAIALRVD